MAKQPNIDPITFEVIKNKLQAIATEQSISLKSVSGSPVVTESSDFGNAICLADGTIVVRGQQLMPHASSITYMLKSVIMDCQENPGYEEGDMFFVNDPWKGALHQSDVGVVAPFFHEGKLVAWSGTVAHQLDVGGMSPGSWCPNATEKYQEGVSFPPVKLVEKGTLRNDIWNVIFAQSRVPFLLGLDLKALIASNNVAAKRLAEIIKRYGLNAVMETMNHLIDLAEEGLRKRLLELPDGIFRAVDFLDHDGHQNKLYKVCVTLVKKDDTLTFDFSGSAPQSSGFINGTESTLWGGILSALFINLAYDLPWNGGIQNPVKVIAPKGIICNAEPPAPVSGAPTAIMRIIHNCCTMAISKLLACTDKYVGEAKGITCGTFVNLMLSGRDQYGQIYSTMFLDPMIGGEGAYNKRDGIDTQGAAQMPTPNISNVESIENLAPVLYLKRWILADTGGAGKYRGGNSAGLAFIVHDVESQKGVLIGHGAEVPNSAGIFGGLQGSCYYSHKTEKTNILDHFKKGEMLTNLGESGGTVKDLGAKPGEIYFGATDVFQYTWQGGGGWGDPLERDPQWVLQDVLEGMVTPEWALKLYGVVIDTKSWNVDSLATEAMRQRSKKERLHNSKPPLQSHQTKVDQAVKLMPIGEYLELNRLSTGEMIITCHCGHQFGTPSQNWKDFAVVHQVSPEAIGPLRRLHEDLEIRQYICPTCATLLSTETCLKSEPALFDIELSL